jgi:hypothetical protein
VKLRALLLAACLPLIAGWSCSSVPAKPGAVDPECSLDGFVQCTTDDGDTGVRWEGDPNQPGTIDVLGEVVIPELSDRLRVCETRRKALAQCLKRLESQGVITPQGGSPR